MPEFKSTYTITITDFEPNNIYPNTQENVHVSCKETGYSGNGNFRVCDRITSCVNRHRMSQANICPRIRGLRTVQEELSMTDEQKKPRIELVQPDPQNQGEPPATVAKPGKFDLNKFRSKADPNIAGVEKLLTALPHHRISDARDFSRLHPDEETHWSFELCFVNVPIKGQKRDTLHLIDEDLATAYLPSKKILRFRLALATLPYDVFFLCQVPSRNLDNAWNSTSLQACEQAKTRWVQAASRKEEGAEGYDIGYAREEDAFPEPRWPAQSLGELIGVTFLGRQIEQENDPALARLIGAKPKL